MYNLSVFKNVFYDDFGLSKTEYFDPSNWMFCEGDEDDYDEGFSLFVFAPKTDDGFDQCLPFGFGGDTDEIWEATIAVETENADLFEQFLQSVGFVKESPWW